MKRGIFVLKRMARHHHEKLFDGPILFVAHFQISWRWVQIGTQTISETPNDFAETAVAG